MKETQYREALSTIWTGLWLLISSWGVTLDRLLRDILHGIRHHWLFAVTLIAIYVVMFISMAQSRAMYHHGEMVNYRLSQAVDSLTIMVKR